MCYFLFLMVELLGFSVQAAESILYFIFLILDDPIFGFVGAGDRAATAKT